MELFTIELPRWRIARNHGIGLLDVSAKSATTFLSTNWDLELGKQAFEKGEGGLSVEAYRRGFHTLMNASWKKHRDKWLALAASKEPIALGCYCRSDHYWGCVCHRYLLVEILGKVCHSRQIPFEYYGELS